VTIRKCQPGLFTRMLAAMALAAAAVVSSAAARPLDAIMGA
jgi:hypothetical protein